MSSYMELALPLEGAGLNYRMNVNTHGLKETGKWQQRSAGCPGLGVRAGCELPGRVTWVRVDLLPKTSTDPQAQTATVSY